MFAKRIDSVEYAIRDLVEVAKKLEKDGMDITYLNIGDPGKYDFETPQKIQEGFLEGGKHNYYSDSQGDLECREKIALKEKYMNDVNISPDDLIITSGVSESINFLSGCLVEESSEALLGGPSYPSYIAFTKFYEGTPVFYRMDEKNGWNPDIEDIEKNITPNTKYLQIINPNNPTGAVYTEKTLKGMINLAGQYDLFLVSDEIYDGMVFDGEFKSTASLTDDVPVIGFNGFSKTYLIPGARLGYVYFANADEKSLDLKENMLKLARIRLCASTPTQKAVIPAIGHEEEFLGDTMKKIKSRADLTYKRLNEIDGISCAKPKGAFYAFPKVELDDKWENDKEFVVDLLKTKGILTVNGSGFGDYGEDHFRIVYLAQENVLSEAFDKIEDFMKEKY